MTAKRAPQSGVTLIEVLLALAVSATVGLAGFVLLDSTLRTQSGVSGKLEALDLHNRVFVLFQLDVESALTARLTSTGALELRHHDSSVTWIADEEALRRRHEFSNRPAVTQDLLSDTAEISVQNERVVRLFLPKADAWRLAPLPIAETP